MTGLDELKRIAGKEKVGLGIVEKDHAITVALMVLSKTRLSEMLVFKGGTAIKKMFYPEARFSEDLDFDCGRDLTSELAKDIRKPLMDNNEGVNFTGVRQEAPRPGWARRLSLQYNDWNGYPNSIKLDLAFREKPVMRTKKIEVKNLYEIHEVTIATMDIREIMAEKVRALIHTKRPRHLHDIWFLLRKGVRVRRDLVNKKLKIYDELFDTGVLSASIEETEQDWQADLKALVTELPEFSEVRSAVLENFSKI